MNGEVVMSAYDYSSMSGAKVAAASAVFQAYTLSVWLDEATDATGLKAVLTKKLKDTITVLNYTPYMRLQMSGIR